MLALDLLAVVAGLVLLTRASDEFVTGAVGLARTLGLSRVVIGAVVVGFGTSAPELLVSGIAAAGGDADVGIGNVLGSNAANLTLVLGAAAIVAPLVVASPVIRREAPIAVGAAALFSLSLLGGISRLEALGLLAVLVAAVILIIRGSSSADAMDAEVADYLGEEGGAAAAEGPLRRHAVRTGLGLLGTVLGAQLLVWGALGIADAAGLSGGFVGLTLVAVGTSLPELVTAIQAARQGEPDLIAGNLLGSNVFNSLGVGAAIGLITPGATATGGLAIAGGFGLVAAVIAVGMMRSGFTVTRLEGALLLTAYVVLVPFLA